LSLDFLVGSEHYSQRKHLYRPELPSGRPLNSKSPTLSQFTRSFLLVLSAVNLILGLLFYILPDSMITIWPWQVKDLAVRFLGAIFLAIALGCWSAVQAKSWQRAKILVLVGGTFFVLTGAVAFARGIGVNGTIAIWPWTAYFLLAGTGLLVMINYHGWNRRQPEPQGPAMIIKSAQLFFAIQTIVVGIFGTMMLLLPATAQAQFWPWRVATPTLQTFGSLFLATCLATGWAFFQKSPKRIIVLLPLDAIFPTLALIAVGIGWSTIVSESPSWLVTGVWVGLYSLVAVGSTLLFLTLRRVSVAQ